MILRAVGVLILLVYGTSIADGQELLKIIAPGTGYSHMKQWAIDHHLVFENFTKDGLLIRGSFQEQGFEQYDVRLRAQFCAGGNYSGKAFDSTLQEFIANTPGSNVQDAFAKERKYIDILAGKSAENGGYEGSYSLRRETLQSVKGIAVGRSTKKESWEVGLFAGDQGLLVQTKRSNDQLCK